MSKSSAKQDNETERVLHTPRTLHLPLEVYAQIKERADKQQRSFNWIAVRLLMAALEEEKKQEFGA